MIVVTVFLSILNQNGILFGSENRKENCQHNHIRYNMKGNELPVFSVRSMLLFRFGFEVQIDAENNEVWRRRIMEFLEKSGVFFYLFSDDVDKFIIIFSLFRSLVFWQVYHYYYYEWEKWPKFLLTAVIHRSPRRHSNSSKTWKKIGKKYNTFSR